MQNLSFRNIKKKIKKKKIMEEECVVSVDYGNGKEMECLSIIPGWYSDVSDLFPGQHSIDLDYFIRYILLHSKKQYYE